MTDRQSTFTVAFDGDTGDINAVLAAFKSSVKSAVSDIQSTASKLDLFANLQSDLSKSADAANALRDRATDLARDLDLARASGSSLGDTLAKQLKAAESAATAASKAYNVQSDQVLKLDAQLKAAGVDTSKLAAEQVRLAAALKDATAAAAQQSAKDLLGFKSLSDVQPQINALNKAFDTLRASGKLSATEIAAAQALLNQKLQETRDKVTGLGSALQTQGNVIKNVYNGAVGPVLAFAATIGVVASSIESVTKAAHDFENELAGIQATTNVTGDELKDLGEGARALATSIGFDVVDGLKALRTILAAGIDPGNALKVLETSANAAKASLTDVGDVAKLSAQLINGFGVQVGDLSHSLDILFQAQKDGGPSLAQFSEGLTTLLPVARQLNIPLEELTAALTVMTKATQDAPLAFSDLQKVLLKLNTQDARTKLQGLGVDVRGLVGTLEQFGEKNIGVEQLTDIGIASTKSAAGLAALTSTAKSAGTELTRLQQVAEPTKAALQIIDDTPAGRLAKFDAALKNLQTTMGETVGSSSKLAVVLADVLNEIDAFLKPTQTAAQAQQQFERSVGLTNIAFGPLVGIIATANLAMTALGLSTGSTSDQMAALTKEAAKAGGALQTTINGIRAAVDAQLAGLNQARAGLITYADDLQKVIAQSQAATQATIADLNTRAKAEIDALDKSTAAEKDTAAQVIAIQTQLAADRLAAITKGQADVIAAIQAEGDARIKAAQLAGQKTVDIERTVGLQILQARLSVLQQIKGQYDAQVASLVALEQGYVAKLNSIDATRVSFSEDIETRLSTLRRQGLSDFDQYTAKVGDINKLLAKAQTAFDQGGQDAVALGKRYTDQALNLVDSLKTVVNENGTEIVSSFDLQQTQIALTTKLADQYKKALADQAQAAQQGANAAVESLDQVRAKLKEVTDEVVELQGKVGAGIKAKLDFDLSKLGELNQQIDDELAKKQHLLDVQVDVVKVQAQVESLVANLKNGVTEGANVQLDAIGTKLKEIADKAPELKLNIATATDQVDAVRAAVDRIGDLKPKLTIDSNAAAVQAQINNLKQPTESTHTIHVVVDSSGVPPGLNDNLPVPGFALGGAVGSLQRTATAAQRGWHAFAAGGPVFPEMTGPKVPGVGNADTVPRALQRGSFVIRKAASQFYGDLAMTKLIAGATVPRFASGGAVGYIGTKDQEALTGEISPPTLPTDPKALRKLVLNYVFDVAAAAVVDDYFYWHPSLRLMGAAKDAYDFNPSDANLDALLTIARDVGLNLGLSHDTKIGFDVDGRKWHKRLLDSFQGGLLGPLSYAYDFYAKGGSTGAGTDKVNALLTPGEFVINPMATAAIGPEILHAINNFQMSREAVSDMLTFSPPPRPARFADGGMVGDAGWTGTSATWQQSRPGGAMNGYGGQTNNIYLQASAQDLFSVDNVRRVLLPVLREINRRSPGSK